MKYIEKLGKIINIDNIYIELILITFISILIIYTIEKIGIKLLKKTKDDKKEYTYTQKFKLIIKILMYSIIIIIWSRFIKDALTFISVISAAFTIALRDLIFNFFCGIYIKINKPFELEDRIEIDRYKGDVVNIKAMNFEILEVDNNTLSCQSTGVIIHVPNGVIFHYPLRNYNKAFKYVWDEITINVPLDCDLVKAKSTIYKIVNSNEILKKVPAKLKKQINNVTNNYRIYYNHYEPIIYTKVEDDHISLQLRYLVHPKKARFVESTIWNNILIAYKNNEIELYKQ